MGFLVYPDNYVPPTPTPPHQLTTEQHDTIKTAMQNYIIAQDRPIWSGDLIRLAQTYIKNNYDKYVDDAQLEAIALEILTEWGAPGG